MTPSIAIEGTETFNASVNLDRNNALHIGFDSQGKARVWSEKIARKMKKHAMELQEDAGIKRDWSM